MLFKSTKPQKRPSGSNLIMDMRPTKVVKRRYKFSFKLAGKNRRVIFAFILLLVLVVLAWTFTSKHTSIGQKELAQVKSKVGKLMLLPSDEEPTLAQVKDRRQLKDPYLVEKAVDGDQILIYTKNGIVIIYRPSLNKIAAVGSVFADPALPEAQGTSLTVLNGSNNDAKTLKIIEEVKTAYPGLKVTNGGNTSRHDFPNTIVIDNTNQKDNLVDALVDVIKGKRGVVPLGESKSETDLMIIVGKD